MAQQDRLSQPPRRLPSIARDQDSVMRSDPWKAAIAQARSEIRALIGSGDLDHDELTLPWIEQ